MAKRTRHIRWVAPALAAAAVYEWGLRPRCRFLGATDEERRGAYPGDELMPEESHHSVMATTLAAPPSEVWPWLVQMGTDRAGFYSWDRLDNGGRPSAECIRPEWQDLRQGDRVSSVQGGRSWFDVALLDPERALVLRASLRFPSARPYDPGSERPCFYSDTTWGYYLSRTDEGQTRLVTTGKARVRPRWAFRLADWAFWDPAHWVMQTRQFEGLRRRVEGQAPASGVPGIANVGRAAGPARAPGD